MLRNFLLCMSLCGAGAACAQAPKLSQDAPIICPADAKADEWLPSANQIAAMERALPLYFAAIANQKPRMPAPNFEYARQYSGIIRDGKKIIHGRYYPASDTPPFFAKPGGCWIVMDGGARYWDAEFDPESSTIIAHGVNGKA